MKMNKKMLAVLLAVVVAIGLFLNFSAKERPAVSPEAERTFMVACKASSSSLLQTFSSLEEFYQLYGEEKGNQCANCMNYYYDTGDAKALDTVKRLVKGMPIGAEVFWLNEYTPASSSALSAKVDVTEAPFPDVPTDAWYAVAVTAMKDSGIINGCDDGLFHPEREVKTGEFYAMLLRAGTRPGVDVTVCDGVSNDTHWAKGVIANAGLAYLWPPKAGHEDDVVLRGEAVGRVTLLRGYAEKKNSSYRTAWEWTMTRERTEGNMTLEDIPDYAVIEQYLKETYEVDASIFAEGNRIVYAYNHGIAKGVDEAGTFNPYGTLTRAEVVQMLYNARFTQRFGGVLYLGSTVG